MNDTFQCAICRGVYEKGRTDEVAMAEAQAIWGLAAEECESDCLTCDTCWQMQMKQDRLLALAFEKYLSQQPIPMTIKNYLHKFKSN